jgi:hypothetical protein
MALGCSLGDVSIGQIGEDPGKESLLGMEDPFEDGSPRIAFFA